MTLTRKLTAGAAAIIATLGLAALAPAEAEAAACGAEGRLIKSYPVTSGNGKQIASLDIYYSERYRGTNTACLHRYGVSWGWESWSLVRITRCDSYYGCDTLDRENQDSDSGRHKYYTGPARVTAASHRCVSVYGRVRDPYTLHKWVSIQAKNIGCAAEPKVQILR